MGRMNFSIAVKLIEQGVAQGANRIKASLRSIQFQAVAMASAISGGISSINDLLRRLVDTARETNRVQTALKNISGGLGAYGENLKYLKNLSAEYGLELNGTTSAFTKFTAAATASGMAMADQQKVFTAVSRSITAFGLSGQEATLTFYAISQMMAKGKISAEELRRQLGERMPVAMEAMQRAAQKLGFKENLDDLLKSGKLRSLDILPQFADELNNMVIKVDTDNAETSVNRLKNSFIGLTEDWDIAGKFKTVVDKVRGFIDSLRQSVALLYGVLGGAALGKAFNVAKDGVLSFWQSTKSAVVREAQEAQKALEQASKFKSDSDTGLVKAQEADNLLQAQARTALEQERERISQRIQQAEQVYERSKEAFNRLEQAHLQERLAKEQQIQALRGKSRKDYANDMASRPAGERSLGYDTWLKKRKDAEAKLKRELAEMELRHAKKLDAINMQVAKNKLKLEAQIASGVQARANAEETANAKLAKSAMQVQLAQEANEKATEAFGEAQERVKEAATRAGSSIKTAMAGVKVSIQRVGLAIKGMLASFAPMLIIGGLISIWQRTKEVEEEFDKAKNSVNEFNTALVTVGGEELKSIENAIQKLKERAGTENEILVLRAKLEAYTNTQKLNEKDLIKLAEQKLELEKKIAKAKFADSEAVKADMELDNMKAQERAKGLSVPSYDDAKEYMKLSPQFEQGAMNVLNHWGATAGEATVKGLFTILGLGDRFIGLDNKRNLRRVAISKRGISANSPDKVRWDWLMNKRADNESESDYAKRLRAYYEVYSRKAVAEQKSKEIISGMSNEEKQALTETIAPKNTTFKPEDPQSSAPKKTELQKAEDAYREGLERLANLLSLKAINTEEYNQGRFNLAKNTTETIGGLLGMKAQDNKTFRTARSEQQELADYYAPSPERDALKGFDKEAGEFEQQLKRGVITTEEFNKAMRTLIDSTIKELASLPQLSEHGGQRLAQLRESRGEGGKFATPIPEAPKRDATFDYKKPQSSIVKEELDITTEQIQKLKEAQGATQEFADKIAQLQDIEIDLSQQFKLRQVEEDIKKLKKTLDKGLYSSIKDVTQAVRGLGNSFKSLKSTFEDEDANAFEKLFAGIEAGLGVLETINSLSAGFEEMQQARQSLSQAEEAYRAIELSSAEQSIAMKQAEMATDATATSAQVSNIATSQGALIADSAVKKAVGAQNIAVSTAEGTASAAKSASALPFPINLIAMGVAVAAALAIFKSLPKFAKGGIVPGNSRSGDKVLAGVNSGELILNEAQQSNIASKLVRGREHISVDVNIRERLRGRDLMRSVKRAERQHKR